jgi:hypothetical protein
MCNLLISYGGGMYDLSGIILASNKFQWLPL